LPCIMDSSSDSNILFSSGTTGEPKAICWSHITPLRAWVDGWAHQDIQIGQYCHHK
jgi:acyl-coenzyme A synthetase/AMP-(fatty) acid ligase